MVRYLSYPVGPPQALAAGGRPKWVGAVSSTILVRKITSFALTFVGAGGAVLCFVLLFFLVAFHCSHRSPCFASHHSRVVNRSVRPWLAPNGRNPAATLLVALRSGHGGGVFSTDFMETGRVGWWDCGWTVGLSPQGGGTSTVRLQAAPWVHAD